jgi:hypothetical protein
VTGFEFARAQGREENSLDVLDWNIERIQSLSASDYHDLSGLDSLLHDLEPEVKFLQTIPGGTADEGKAIKVRRKKITRMIRELKDKIEKKNTKSKRKKRD